MPCWAPNRVWSIDIDRVLQQALLQCDQEAGNSSAASPKEASTVGLGWTDARCELNESSDGLVDD